MHRTFLPALAVILLAAGCTTPAVHVPDPHNPTGADYDAIEAAIGRPLSDPKHDHSDPAQHAASYNLVRVALATGEEGRTPASGEAYLETAVKDGYAYMCRTGPQEGLVIFDVHDIEHPKFVSYLHLDAGFEADVEVSDDGHWAFWETQRAGVNLSPPDATDPAGSLPRGIHIIDISDKAHPKWVGFTPVAPDGPHSITYANINGADYVFGSIYSWQYVGTSGLTPTVAPPMTQRETIYRLDTSGPIAQLQEVATYVDPQAAETNPVMPTGGLFPHDVSISVHPVTHKTYAYVAYWNLGVVILDVSDPAHPTKVGQATDFGPAGYRNVHMARQFAQPIAGKVIAVAEPEIGDEPETGYMTLFDVTDPAHPTYVSSWLIPGNQTSQGGLLGPHYFDVRDGRVAMASYHAGFWVFDVHDAANLAHPRTVAFALVNSTGPTGGPTTPLTFTGGPDNAFDAWWADGHHVLGGDTNGGLAVYRYTGPDPMQVTE